MTDFSNLNLSRWIIEDLQELEVEYPGLFDRSFKEINDMASNFYWEAERLNTEAIIWDSKATALREYLDALIKQEKEE